LAVQEFGTLGLKGLLVLPPPYRRIIAKAPTNGNSTRIFGVSELSMRTFTTRYLAKPSLVQVSKQFPDFSRHGLYPIANT
jgi:hypothetical protein